jgi:hypothetical protein
VGQTAEGLDAIAEALALVASTNERFYEAEIYRVKGELLLKHGGSNTGAEAERCFRQALDIARVQVPNRGSCALQPVSPGCGATRAGEPRPVICSRRSTAGSPKASTPPI